jgi:hypothetical protein
VGTIPASIGSFTSMQSFEVAGNGFTGSLPSTIPFANLEGGNCILLQPVFSNLYACPWPAGTENACLKHTDTTGGTAPITNNDCVPPSPAPGNTCTGASTQLPAAQCTAWIKLYDSTGGKGWTRCQLKMKRPANLRTDPCGCQAGSTSAVCNPDRTTVVNL